MQTPRASSHLIPTWHKSNANVNDIMMMWFALHENLVMPCQACTTCIHMHVNGTHALSNMGASKYSSGLVCKQANTNLAKITASHFQVLNTENANKNTPNMIPIAYLNEKLHQLQ